MEQEELAEEDSADEAEQVERILLQALRSALQQAPGLPVAHRILAEHYHARHAAAEAVGDHAAAARFEAQLAEHDDGRFADWLRGDGQLSLTSDPPGAFAVLHRYVERDRQLRRRRPRQRVRPADRSSGRPGSNRSLSWRI